MRYAKPSFSTFSSIRKVYPIEMMYGILKEKQAAKDLVDSQYDLLKEKFNADVLPVDQPKYLEIKQALSNSIDSLSESDLPPEQLAKEVVRLNRRIEQEMTNGFTAQASGNKKNYLEYKDGLHKQAKDLGLNSQEIDKFVNGSLQMFVANGGSINKDGQLQSFEGYKPVKRYDVVKEAVDVVSKNVPEKLSQAQAYFKGSQYEGMIEGVNSQHDWEVRKKSVVMTMAKDYIETRPELKASLAQEVDLGYATDFETLYNKAVNNVGDILTVNRHSINESRTLKDDTGYWYNRKRRDDKQDAESLQELDKARLDVDLASGYKPIKYSQVIEDYKSGKDTPEVRGLKTVFAKILGNDKLSDYQKQVQLESIGFVNASDIVKNTKTSIAGSKGITDILDKIEALKKTNMFNNNLAGSFDESFIFKTDGRLPQEDLVKGLYISGRVASGGDLVPEWENDFGQYDNTFDFLTATANKKYSMSAPAYAIDIPETQRLLGEANYKLKEGEKITGKSYLTSNIGDESKGQGLVRFTIHDENDNSFRTVSTPVPEFIEIAKAPKVVQTGVGTNVLTGQQGFNSPNNSLIINPFQSDAFYAPLIPNKIKLDNP